MKSEFSWTDARLRQFHALCAQNQSNVEIAEAVGCHSTTVGVLRNRLGIPPKQTQSEWDDARIERLKSLWNDGYSAGKIGRIMGASRNAIIGKIQRSDLPKRPTTMSVRGPTKATEIKEPRQGPLRNLPVPEAKPYNGTDGVSFIKLGPKCCKWPLGDIDTKPQRFCGQGVSGRNSFCDEHHSIAFVPPREFGGRRNRRV